MNKSDEFRAIESALQMLPDHRARLATVATVALHELCLTAQQEGVPFDVMLAQFTATLQESFAAIVAAQTRRAVN